MRVCALASGSSGNCALVESESAKILIDAGLSTRQVRERLDRLGMKSNQIDALLITHEHIDHTREAGLLAISLDCPIYATERTLPGFREYLSGHETIRSFSLGREFYIKDLQIHPFRVFHDAREPCGFLIREAALFAEHAKSLGIATDLGTVTDQLTETLKDCDVLVLESNHDLDMLIQGDYPWHLKQRIRSEVGHLSNDAAGQAIATLARRGRLTKVLLAHLSENNNRPHKALATVQGYLNGLTKKIELYVAPRDRLSRVIEF
jgi:phosphoribosyl 1,2-cyclic phosphodiesterase